MKILNNLPLLSALGAVLGGSCITLGGYPMLPGLLLIPVYYWLVFRPDLIPIWGLFLVGLFYDALLGTEIGISSILLMTSVFIAQYLRPFLNPNLFHHLWIGFFLYSLGYLSLYAILTRGRFSLFISWVSALILYPLIARGLSYLQARLRPYA